MKLTKERCLKAVSRLHSLCKGIKNEYPLVERKKGEKMFSLNLDSDYGVLKLVNEDKDVLEQLIEEYFESHKLSYNELDFIIECVKPYEKELGLDVEILVSKLKSMKDEAKEKVEKVFIWD